MKGSSYSLGKAGRISWVMAVVVLCASLAAAVQAGSAATSTRAVAVDNSATFTAGSGQNPAAPVIKNVTVSNDDSGSITFIVRLSNRTTLPEEESVLIFLDTDRNPTTGGQYGSEVVLMNTKGTWSRGTVLKWNGHDLVWEGAFASSSANGEVVFANAVGLTLGALGITDSFNFRVVAGTGGMQVFNVTAVWTYDTTPPPPPPTPGSITAAVSITAVERTGDFPGGTFTAAGPAKAAGLICASGKTANDYGPNQGNTSPVTIKLDKIFACDDRSGTFTLRLNVQLDTVTGQTTATWDVTRGTLAYASLHGHGSLKGVPNANRTLITDYYTGTLTGQAPGASVPPKPGPSSPLKAVIGAPSTSPNTATAGKRFVVTFPVKRSDNGAALKTGKMICDPSVAGKVIPHSEQFKNGNASLSFVVPKSASGKLLKVKLTIKVGTKSTTRVANFRVAAPVSVTPGTNHAPGWPQMTYDVSTSFTYDTTGRLTGAVTTIKISPAIDPDGDTLSYSWTATSGSIVGDGLTATWKRLVTGGSVQDGDVVVTANDGRGGTAQYTLRFR